MTPLTKRLKRTKIVFKKFKLKFIKGPLSEIGIFQKWLFYPYITLKF